MAEFTVNPERHDPYKGFKFRVKCDGRYIAGISQVSALRRSTEVVRHREGGDPSTSRLSPGLTSFEPITLRRGVTHDTTFEEWANQIWRLGADHHAEVGLASFRRDLVIEVNNEAGQLVLAYKVYRCWISDYEALPALDAHGNTTLIQSITLQHEGWERDVSIPEPVEPSTTSA